MAWILSLLVPFLIAVLWHGFSLQIASVLAGEEAPGFTRAAFTSWMGGIAGGVAFTAWSWTVGLAVSMFLSAYVSWAIGIAVAILTTGAIYRRGLKLSVPASLGVTVIHMVLSTAVNAFLGWFVYSSLV